jgi:hypothetical protein
MEKKNKSRDTKKMLELKKDLFFVYLEENGGNVDLACRNSKLARSTARRWMAEDKDFMEKVDEIRGFLAKEEDEILSDLEKELKGMKEEGHEFNGTPTARRKKKEFVESFPKLLFSVTKTCKKVEISRRTYHNWRNNDEIFNEAIKILNEQRMEFGEDCLYRSMNKLHPQSILFWMRTKGKDLGYNEKNEITVNRGIDAKDLENLDPDELELYVKLLEKIQKNRDDS